MRIYFFFFFQAEDGIRDYKVTGVQTCALPISRVDVARKDIEKMVDDRNVIHGESSCTGEAVATALLSSAGSSKLGGIGGRSASVWYSSGPVLPERKRRKSAWATCAQDASSSWPARHCSLSKCSRDGSAESASTEGPSFWPQPASRSTKPHRAGTRVMR